MDSARYSRQLAQLRTPVVHLLPSLDAPCNVVTTLEGLPVKNAHHTRQHFLHEGSMSPVVIAASPSIPFALVEHLLRNKRDSAIAFKWIPGSQITNMEGMLHTFVTAFARIKVVGDYAFNGRHDVQLYEDEPGKLCTRSRVLSTQIQPDFEDDKVAFAFCRIGKDVVVGECLRDDEQIPSRNTKQDDEARAAWDDRLRRHMIHALMPNQQLPSVDEILETWSPATAAQVIRADLQQSRPRLHLFQGCAVSTHGQLLSLELLANVYACTIANELTALESCCTRQGYIFTYDPPAIFARMLSAELLNLIYIFALRIVAAENQLRHLRVFAFNDYADPSMLDLVKRALERHVHVRVLRRSDLYPFRNAGYLDSDNEAVKDGATLVIHNNSDAFGQNIETEMVTSLDGAIGIYSDAASVLRRDRPDLVDHRL
ncbi:hypothetical protein OIV83_002210 [Microbotryomycetes sp. JL201]|nr:hypothetical protein OIV83_002210 [Microbotryomycetes sp. JL201]